MQKISNQRPFESEVTLVNSAYSLRRIFDLCFVPKIKKKIIETFAKRKNDRKFERFCQSTMEAYCSNEY